jgi:hypothetical protein
MNDNIVHLLNTRRLTYHKCLLHFTFVRGTRDKIYKFWENFTFFQFSAIKAQITITMYNVIVRL